MNRNYLMTIVALLCLGGGCAKAQYTFIYEDTIGMYPYFYYGDFPKTGIYHPDSTPCGLTYSYEIVGYGTSVSAWPDEYALKMHTDDTLRVIGIVCGYLSNQDTMRVSVYDSAMNRLSYAKFQQLSFVQNVCNDTQYHSLHVRGCQYSDPFCNYRNLPETFWFAIFDGKWGNPVNVVGDFYVAITSEYTPRRDEGVSQCFWHENHGAPWYFPGSDYRVRYDSMWVDGHTERSLPNLFPIIDPPCVSIDSVTVEADSAGCVTVRWDSLPMQAHWMVSFGPEGTAAGEGETDTVSERQWRRCGLEPGGSYTVSVRSRCNLLYRQEWSPWSSVWTVTAGSNPDPEDPDPEDPPEGIREVAGTVGFTLRPNPAREEVTLGGGAWMSGGVLTVTDMRGTEVVRRKVESGRLTLDVSRLPKGAYTVSVTTSEGTAARRLVVQ